jgi:TPR repeat protein
MSAHPETERANILFDEGRYREAMPRYLEMAGRGDAGAMLRLGWMFQHGLGIPVDHEQAKKWYRSAVEAGSVDGQYYLGWLHWTGRELELARALWQEAAGRGHLGALFRLGAMYDFGEGIGRDEIRARSYYEQAAARGHVRAQRALAGKMIRGHYGALRVPAGFYLIAKTVWKGTRTMARDQFSEQLR